MHPDMQLRMLLAQPRVVQALQAHGRSNPETDPVKRVQQAMATIAPNLAEQAAMHAQAAIGNRGVEKQSSRLVHTQEIAGANPASATSLGDAGATPAATQRNVGANPTPPTTFKAHPSILQHARQAPDGHHYVPDPNRPGKYARVVAAPGSGPANAGGTGMSPATNMREVEMIRHGSTDLNSDDTSVDRIRAHKDVPLNQEGKNEAAATGKELATRADEKPDVMVSSDLCRAKLTAQIISDITKIPVSWVTEHFRPWDAGQLTGQKSKDAVPVMAQYAEHQPDTPIPGGESFHTFLGRFFIGLDAALEKHPSQRLAIISHHRNERVLHAWKARGFPADGSIDIPTFNQKGEKTGVSQKIQIPVDRVRAVAQRYRAQAAQEPPAQRQISDDRPGQE